MTCEEMIYSNDYADVIIGYIKNYVGYEDVFEKGCLNLITQDIAVLHLQRSSQTLYNLETVPYSAIPKPYGLMDSSNLEAAGIKRVQNPSGLGLRGEGVIVGMIDTGIDYENPLFRKADGTTRIGVIWDQTMPGKMDESGQTEALEEEMPGILKPVYGRAFDSETINRVLAGELQPEDAPSKDENGHGTFMAGIAAGGVDDENDFTGIATESEIAVVKLKEAKPYIRQFFGIPEGVPAYSEVDIIYAVNYLLRYASRRKRPISIMIGLGTSFGGHKGLTFLERYLERSLKTIGVMVSVPVGNEGSAGLHFAGVLNGGLEQTVEINVGQGQEDLAIEFWGEQPDTFAIGLISPQGDRIERIAPRFGKEELIRLPLSKTTIYVAYQLVEAYTGDEFVFIRLNSPTPGIWRIIVYGEGEKESSFNMWMPLRQFLQQDTYFLRPTPDNTLTAPGSTETVMTMTAYNHLNGSIYANASRGYNTSGLVKPDLAAPGVNVSGPGLRNNFVRRSGTSVAAAHSTGMMAQFLQWMAENQDIGPFYPSQIQSLCLRSAVRQSDIIYPNPVWGYGIMNIEQMFEEFRIIQR